MIKCFVKNLIIISVIVISFLLVAYFMPDYQTKKALSKYQPIIDDIIEYKNINNLYPDTIKPFNNKPKEFSFYKYETYNNNKDFIFLVSAYNYDSTLPYLAVYRYCSTVELDGCNPYETDKFVSYSAIGNWVETHYKD